MKIRVWVELDGRGKQGSAETVVDVPDEDLKGLQGAARERVLDGYAFDAQEQLFLRGWEELGS